MGKLRNSAREDIKVQFEEVRLTMHVLQNVYNHLRVRRNDDVAVGIVVNRTLLRLAHALVNQELFRDRDYLPMGGDLGVGVHAASSVYFFRYSPGKEAPFSAGSA